MSEPLKPDEFRCAACKRVFAKGWSDQEKRAEKAAMFPNVSVEECDEVCDDCFQQMGHASHRWSGWPGAWCLDCGMEDPIENALADGKSVEVPDADSPLGFYYEFPGVQVPFCPEPGSRRHDPYARSS